MCAVAACLDHVQETGQPIITQSASYTPHGHMQKIEAATLTIAEKLEAAGGPDKYRLPNRVRSPSVAESIKLGAQPLHSAACFRCADGRP